MFIENISAIGYEGPQATVRTLLSPEPQFIPLELYPLLLAAKPYKTESGR